MHCPNGGVWIPTQVSHVKEAINILKGDIEEYIDKIVPNNLTRCLD